MKILNFKTFLKVCKNCFWYVQTFFKDSKWVLKNADPWKKDAIQFLQKSQCDKNEGFKQFFILLYSFQKLMAFNSFWVKFIARFLQNTQTSIQYRIFTSMTKFSEQICIFCQLWNQTLTKSKIVFIYLIRRFRKNLCFLLRVWPIKLIKSLTSTLIKKKKHFSSYIRKFRGIGWKVMSNGLLIKIFAHFLIY